MNPEIIRYSYIPEELNKLFARQRRPMSLRFLLSAFLFIATGIFAVIAPGNTPLAAFLFGVGICLLCISLLLMAGSKKSNRYSATTMSGRINQYKIFDACLTLEQFQEKELIRFYRIPFAEIDQIQDWDTHYSINHAGLSFILRKETLSRESALLAYMESHPEKFTTAQRIAAGSFFGFLAIAVLFLAILFLNFPGALFAGQELWIALGALPAPLALLIYGYSQKAKGAPAGRHIFNGWLLLFLLIFCTLNSIL